MILIEKMKFHFGENREAVRQKIESVCNSLNIDPSWLMLVMLQESGLNSRAVNKQKGDPDDAFTRAKTRATGLIQFMPATAAGLGTSTQALYNMNTIQQLDYVQKYYAPYKNKIQNFHDLYLATFFPAAMGKQDDYILQTSKISAETISAQNPGFDLNKDGKITVGEFREVITKRVPAQFLEFVKKKNLPLEQEQLF
ncbi:MAG: lytic transglycosylase domain-containing protein [Bacteroidales bacterium]|nr:lytic transglycosylase domain-containing protein [Bacteroidales bacterium]